MYCCKEQTRTIQHQIQTDTIRGQDVLIELKRYQTQTVAEFDDYLKRIRTYKEVKPHASVFNHIQSKKHHTKLYNERDINSPYICIRIPTGGGKTLVACHLLNSLYQEYLRSKNEKGLVLWLVPTDAIRSQTISALKDIRHPYRQVLNSFFSDNVLIYDSNEAKSIKKSDMQDNLCIIIATFSTFRITETEGRKAYAENGYLMEHFQDLTTNDLLKDDNGNITESLVNVIRMNSPIVVVDEAHNAGTPLSGNMFADFKPCFILEYTATPKPDSNILVNITAQQLKEESMIKIPIYLKNIAQWQATIRDGTAKRNHLEDLSKKIKNEYIRPIALIQAEQEKENPDKIHVRKIKEFLISDQKIPAAQIAIRTGKQNDLEGTDLYSKNCPIRYIITVQALKEGWDNAFAYVLISVANIGAKVSVEQTIGRILRLPKQQEKRIHDLNCSYVYTSSNSFNQAAKDLEKGLIQQGYSKKDFQALEEKITKQNIYNRSISDDDIKIPCIAINDGKIRRISFHDDLLGADFSLSSQKTPDDYVFYFDENKMKKIDIKQGDEFEHSVQTSLDIVYENKDFDEKQLLNWLDSRIRRMEYSQTDKRKYLTNIIHHALKQDNLSLSDLSINCYTFRDNINKHIDQLETGKAKESFQTLEKSDRLYMDKVYYWPEETMEMSDICEEPFNLHLFECAGHMNDEELDLALKIDGLSNIRWWYRNMEKSDFYIQGWQKSRFYPDLIIKTKSNKYVIVEYKGENLLTNDDTKYKKELGCKWAELAGDDYHFYLVSKDNVAQSMTSIAKL